MGLGGFLAKADLDALKSEGLRRTVVGSVLLLALVPGWWFFDPATIYWTMLAIGATVMGLPVAQVVQDTIKKHLGGTGETKK